jgi:thiol-disulfide isomerase/thioredoxin
MNSKLLISVLLLLAVSNALAQSSINRPEIQPHINPDAQFRSLDSTNPIKMADYGGRVVVVALWASWCGPCRMALIGLVDLQKDFAERGVPVIALTNEDPGKAYADVRRFVAGFPPDYRVGWISTISANQLMSRKDIVPQILVVRDGVILKSFLGWNPTMTVSQLRLVLDKAQGRAETK